MIGMLEQIRIAMRGLSKRPGFAITSILILGIGIGATAAMFTLIHSLLLKKLPLGDPDRLTILYSTQKDPSGKTEDFGPSTSDFLDWRERNRSFTGLGAMFPDEAGITGTTNPEQIKLGRISVNLFSVLGVSPLKGRIFSSSEESSDDVAILSYSFYKSHFDGVSDILQRTISLDNKPFRIIGVMPSQFYFASEIDLWLPLDLTGARTPRTATRNLYVTGRLKPNTSIESASVEMKSICSQLAKEFPDTNRGWSVRIAPIRDQQVQSIRAVLKILMAAVLFLLLITCANVANLMLTRSVERKSAMALRLVMGANRFQLLREPLLESLLIALAGGALGFLLSCWSLDPLISMSPLVASSPDGAKILNHVSVDYSVFTFTFLVALLTAAVFGILPNLQQDPQELVSSLSENARRSTFRIGGRRAQKLLVLVELTVAFVLLIGAGIMLKSFKLAQKTDIGFQPKNILTMKINLPPARYDDHQKRSAFLKEAIKQLERIPGATSAAASTRMPLNEFSFVTDFAVEGLAPSPSGELPSANFRRITRNYFRTIGTQIIQGRDFSDIDNDSGQPVAIVSREMADHFWPGQSALGKRIQRQSRTDHVWRTIVGVVSDIKDYSVVTASSPTLYIPYAQNSVPTIFIVLKSAVPVENLTNTIHSVLWQIDKDLAISDVKTMESLFSDSLSKSRFAAYLISLFAIVGLLLAVIGTYGVISYHAIQRTNEIGIRMAIGASEHSVVWLVVKEAALLSILGIALGFVLSLSLSRFISGLIFGISPTDSTIYFSVTILLLVIGIFASYFPGRKASRMNPVEALRV